MTETIRKIREDDFQEVSDLFEGQKYNSAEDLKWLFADSNNENNYNAFVALSKDNMILGVIAYIKATYVYGDKEFVGICPMSWMLKSGYKGMAGISLFKEVSKQGDVAFAISGEEISQKLYSMFKYKKVGYFDNHFKIIKPFEYFKILKKRTFLKKLGMFMMLMPSYFTTRFKKNKCPDIELISYNYDNFVAEKENKTILTKKITKNYIDWMLQCPFLKTKAFVIKKGGESLGLCVLYMEKVKNTLKGRIVHLPFMDHNEHIWASVIDLCTKVLKKEGCCFVSGLSVHDMSRNALTKAGFISLKNYRENIYVKDDNKTIGDFKLGNWNMQFSEGDIFLRNF